MPETSREFLSVDDFDDGSFAWGKFGRQWVAGGVEIGDLSGQINRLEDSMAAQPPPES